MLRTFLRNPDGQSAIFFILVGTAGLYFGRDLPFGSLRQMGAGFFPVCIGVLLIGIGMLVAVQAFRFEAEAMPKPDWRALFAITAAVVIAALLMASVGIVIAIPAMVAIAALSAGRPRIAAILGTASGLTFMAWAIFIFGLGLRIPVLEF
ncbi:tripartite tricarboxylate transporter TctB family protein [Pseudorhizobium pelagicum]|uniref:DUF1468 domain-containing protein n=1 Tax=Pseudorhizobium pelagicum TaxID=1509405 RepID=A0A922P0B9_9HYPH|nr:tripartite tricarboxylate transporter TctB family protein [Pseudorhizobium pelagicum]KEQ03696.1 hypothetical protein GV67_12585 [Pseudorhizobium pelagicum]KEQ08249.1 hypothetical protein GV68_02820 [Pseudorhizobium pelagicum]